MKEDQPKSILAREEIIDRIYTVRGERIMLDKDLADLYEVETRLINQAAKRNIDRFPEDFMFQLTEEEWNRLRSQFVILDKRRGQHSKYRPFAFTEQGVAMLSSVLNSKRAIAVNVQIMRVFVNIRAIASQHKDILQKLDRLEKKVSGHDEDIQEIFRYMKELLEPSIKERKRIGYVIPNTKDKTKSKNRIIIKSKSKKKN